MLLFTRLARYLTTSYILNFKAELEKLAAAVRLEKRAKATITEQAKPSPSITTYANGVTIEDVDEDAEGNDQSQEMTDNTPETRVRVGLILFLPRKPSIDLILNPLLPYE